MLISKLQNHLAYFCKKDNQFRAMLIDGEWGCGKTYSVSHFFQNNYEANHVYLSLFGLKNNEDIIVRLSEYLDSSFIVNVDGNFSLKSSLKELAYNGNIIIFDDLERVEDGLSFSSIYGIIDSLKNLGFKVICICHSAYIKNKQHFKDFKEKAIDIVINVKADSAQFPDVIGVSVDFENTLLETVGGNWRMIKRASYIYYDILKAVQEVGHNNFLQFLDLDESALFRCVVLAVDCLFGKAKGKPTFKDEYTKIFYEYEIKGLDEEIGNNFYYLFSQKSENQAYKGIVRAILESLIESDGYKKVIELVKPETGDSKFNTYPFDKELFYLDDEGHNDYKKAFLTNLPNFDFLDKQQERIFRSILSNCLDELTDQEINKIIKQIIKSVPNEQAGRIFEDISMANDGTIKTINTFTAKLQEAFKSKLNKENRSTINDFIINRDYKELTNYLYNNKYATDENKEIILKILEEKDFCLPDLSKEVNHSSWGYCHEVARFVANTKYQELFIDVLKKQCKKSSSLELRKKCNALVKYNFKIKMNFISLFPIK